MEIDYGAVFDVEVPETTTGAEETEVAEPSEDDTITTAAQGAEEQEAAAPAVEETEEPEQPQTEAPEQEPKTDRDAQFAAARRKAEAERDAAIARAKEDAQKQVDEFFKNSGLMNPYTGHPITTRRASPRRLSRRLSRGFRKFGQPARPRPRRRPPQGRPESRRQRQGWTSSSGRSRPSTPQSRSWAIWRSWTPIPSCTTWSSGVIPSWTPTVWRPMKL